MSADLSGQVVAVTGASSGIGEATALACAQAGAAVALAARRADRIEALAQRITDEGGRALAVAADVGEEDEARGFVERAHRELGRLDVLVNNAGVMLLGPIEGAPTEEWRRMVHVNIFGVLYCSHAALPLMREQGHGHIVNVSSVAGRFARAGSGVYNLTKFGVSAFSEALRQEGIDARRPRDLGRARRGGHRAGGHNREEVLAELRQDLRRRDAAAARSRSPIRFSTPSASRREVSINEILVPALRPGEVTPPTATGRAPPDGASQLGIRCRSRHVRVTVAGGCPGRRGFVEAAQVLLGQLDVGARRRSPPGRSAAWSRESARCPRPGAAPRPARAAPASRPSRRRSPATRSTSSRLRLKFSP